MFIHPRQVDDVMARVPAVRRSQAVVTRSGHQDVLTLLVELGPGADADRTAEALVEAARAVLKLRADVEVAPPGRIAEGARRIDDRRTWG
jgi:phenylacetate-CoA ligase